MATEIGPWQYAIVLSRASLLGRSVMQWKRMEKRLKERQRERERESYGYEGSKGGIYGRIIKTFSTFPLLYTTATFISLERQSQ